MILNACDEEGGGGAEVIDLACQLAEDLQNLHEWLTKGGFLPHIWEANRAKTADHEDADLAVMVCKDFICTINAVGGVCAVLPEGAMAPVIDKDWIDLGETYMLACAAVGAPPMRADGEDDA
jgi:hypothetical protein